MWTAKKVTRLPFLVSPADFQSRATPRISRQPLTNNFARSVYPHSATDQQRSPMLKIRFGFILALAGGALFSSCTSKSEVVQLQPATKLRVVRVSSPTVMTSAVVKTRKVGNPKPSPWATDVVSSYDDEKN